MQGATVIEADHVRADGCYVGGHIRPENRKEDRIDRRLSENQTSKREVVVAARERGGRTLTAVFKSEDTSVSFIKSRVEKGTVVHTDEAMGWEALRAKYAMKVINHSLAYSADDACTNQAESFFSRLRRAQWGQHHRISRVPGPVCRRNGVAGRSSPSAERLAVRNGRQVRGSLGDVGGFLGILAAPEGCLNHLDLATIRRQTPLIFHPVGLFEFVYCCARSPA